MQRLIFRLHRRARTVCLQASLPILALLAGTSAASAQQSVARQWDETILNAIRHDLARPPMHARNLYHFSVAMYDGWAVYDQIALPVLTQERHTAGNIESARAETISYAAYRILRQRFAGSPNAGTILPTFD